MNDDLRRLIFHRYRLGESVEHLADVFQRTVGSVYRVVGQMRAARIRELPLDYVAAPEFKSLSPEQVARYCRAVPQEVETNPAPKYPRRMEGGLTELPDFVEIDAIDEPDRKTERRAAGGFKVRPDSGLPPYLEGLYLNPLLTRTQETHLFRKMNLLKYEAAALRESLDPEHPKSHIMSKIERLYDDAIATKNRIVTANLRLVVSIAKRHIGTGINFFDLISDGNIALIRAVEKFDYTRGNKFSTYATWAVIRCFARAIPDEKKHRLRYRLVEDELFDMQEDSRTDFHIEEKEQTEREVQIDRLLGELDEREQQIITRRYGLGDSKASQTLREVGSEMGVTKERVRQIEARALQKLRKVVEEENLEIPGL
ncbi:MAG TPA: hypothetical protein DEB39_10020 [Planctomycetaceae bacterium]|nr:hypothetical protein [Planctomycetaceae bacterium]